MRLKRSHQAAEGLACVGLLSAKYWIFLFIAADGCLIASIQGYPSAGVLARVVVDASSYKRPIDNLQLFLEGGHTQIKRAYELSVCLRKQRQSSPIIASAGVPGS